ncbi:MAG: glucose-1-phosphate adenylyltransferase subunit GlgD [Clostridia bacterium]|nr:glucose-1-phosphate adenylyltransferase subunit GlgD [Clostridia bacterium]
MNQEAFGLIFTGESNPLMRDLVLSRAVAAVPFGGRYRCIDFVLSNLVNTGIRNVGLIVQKNYHSLMDHLGTGKEWDLNRKRDGLFLLPPFSTKDNTGVYRGDIDAFHSIMQYVRRSSQKTLIICGSHTVFNTTFDAILKQHKETGADITIMYNEDPRFFPEEQNRDLRLLLDEDGMTVNGLEWNPRTPGSNYRSCEINVINKDLFEDLVEEAYSRGMVDFVREVMLPRAKDLKVMGWRYDGYVARIDSINTYFMHNMELLNATAAKDLYNMRHPIYTKVKDEIASQYGEHANVKNVLMADGCLIDGAVENSIVFRGVTVERGAVVKNSILMQGVAVRSGAVLDHVILDKNVTVNAGRQLTGYEGIPLVFRKNLTI